MLLDPVDPKQWNAYAYAGNNPLTYSDASGMLMLGGTDNSGYNQRNGKSSSQGASYSADQLRHDAFDRLAGLLADTGGACSRLMATTASVSCGTQRDYSAELKFVSDTAVLTGASLLEMIGTYPLASGFGGLSQTLGGRAAKEGAGAAATLMGKSLATGTGKAVFWSGLGRDGADVAADWAAKNGGATLESTLTARGVGIPMWDAANPAAVAAWEDASAQFANGASGNVRVLLGDSVNPTGVWTTVEFPALKANANVTSITSINPQTGISSMIWKQ